jgi:hypothetical protein
MFNKFEWNGYNVRVTERPAETSITFAINDCIEGQYSFKNSYEFIYAYLTNSALSEMVGNDPIQFYEFKRKTIGSEGLSKPDFEMCVKELAEKYTVIKHVGLDDKYDNNYKISEFMLALYTGELLAYAEKIMLGIYEANDQTWTIEEVNYSDNVKDIVVRLVEYSCYNSNEYDDALEVIRNGTYDYCVENLESLVDQSLEYHIFDYDHEDKRGRIRDVHVIDTVPGIIETDLGGKKTYFPTTDFGEVRSFSNLDECLLYEMFGPKHYDSVVCIYKWG